MNKPLFWTGAIWLFAQVFIWAMIITIVLVMQLNITMIGLAIFVYVLVTIAALVMMIIGATQR